MKDETIKVICPAHKTLFGKFLVGRQLTEFLCRKCTAKWRTLTRTDDVSVYHRFDKQWKLIETVIVEKGKERLLEKHKKRR